MGQASAGERYGEGPAYYGVQVRASLCYSWGVVISHGGGPQWADANSTNIP